MARGGRGHARTRSDLPVNAEINVTSLVDVAFTLLVIFIITAPILQGGIEVALPKADVQPLTSQDDPLFVTIERDGRVFLEETEVTLEDLASGLAGLAAGNIERVYIRGDSLAPWGRVARAMASTNNSGIAWSVVIEPAPRN